MAISTNFKSSQDLKVIIGDESTIGSGTLLGGRSWYQLGLISPPTIDDNFAVLDTGTQQTGSFITNHNHMKHRTDNPLWEIQIQFLGGASSVAGGLGYLFNTTSSPAVLDSDYSPEDMTHASVNTVRESAVIYIGGARHNQTYNDYKYKGCICKSVELSHSIDANGGFPVITATFVTGYPYDANNDITDGNGTTLTWTDISNQSLVPWNGVTALVGKHIEEAAGSSNYDQRAYGYNVSMSRDIQRVGYDATNQPLSYEMVGGMEVSGDVTFLRNDKFGHVQDYFNNGIMSGFEIEGSGYLVTLNGFVSENSVDTGSPDLRNTVSFKGAGNPKLTGSITGFGSPDGGNLTVTSAVHGLSAGQKITISGTTSYNGDEEIVSIIDKDSFYITSGDSGSETGTWTLHDDSKKIISIDL